MVERALSTTEKTLDFINRFLKKEDLKLLISDIKYKDWVNLLFTKKLNFSNITQKICQSTPEEFKKTSNDEIFYF